MRELNMNGIDAARIGKSNSADVRRDAPPAEATPSKPRDLGDRVELSDEAQKLLQDTGAYTQSRQSRIEAARRKMADGSLFSPETIQKTAENLLRSGELSKADDKPAV